MVHETLQIVRNSGVCRAYAITKSLHLHPAPLGAVLSIACETKKISSPVRGDLSNRLVVNPRKETWIWVNVLAMFPPFIYRSLLRSLNHDGSIIL